MTRSLPPRPLPALDLADGIPDHLRTLVAVPVLLHDTDELLEQIRQLEVHHLSSTAVPCTMRFCRTRWMRQPRPTSLDAPLITTALAEVARLNERHPGAGAARFFFLHRKRLWSRQRASGWAGSASAASLRN